MSSTLFNLYFLLFCSSCVKGEVCFTDGVSWTDEYLQSLTPYIASPAACLDLCTKTDGCVAFTFLSKDYDQVIPEFCITYTDIGKPLICEECTSGLLEDCQLCKEYKELDDPTRNINYGKYILVNDKNVTVKIKLTLFQYPKYYRSCMNIFPKKMLLYFFPFHRVLDFKKIFYIKF